MIELGPKVRDIVTGYTGLAIARVDHLFSVPEIKVQLERLDDNGKPFDPVWFEESRVVQIGHESIKPCVDRTTTGTNG